jgi:hypothetical protein
MYKNILTTSALVLGMAAAAPPVAACGARDSVVRNLGEKYGEVRRGGGLTGSTAIYEIWASETTGTWTILKTTPNGMACVMAVGEGWQDEVGKTAEVGSPV